MQIYVWTKSVIYVDTNIHMYVRIYRNIEYK